MTLPEVPVIDLSLNETVLARQVEQACTSSGFFYVLNHEVPQELINNQFEENRKLFALPQAEKMKLLADENNRGYTALLEEILNPEAQSKGDTKEGYYIGREVSADSTEAQIPLHGPNQWPSTELLPRYRTVQMGYFNAMHQLGMRLLRLLALALKLPPTFFDDKFDPPMLFLRPLHYSSEVSQPDKGIYGAGAHTDYGMLTLLATDGTPGLQICLSGKWHDVEPIPGTFIVNLGDMLERWTNGLFKSTLHRVVSTSGRDRYSTPFFFEPNFYARVEALPQCCGGQPPKLPPTTAGQHLLDKYATTHTGYAGYTGAPVKT